MTYTIYIDDAKTTHVSTREYAIQLIDFYANLIYNKSCCNILFKTYVEVKHKIYFN